MKCCIDCGELKPLSEYYKHPRIADGHLNSCKECRKAYQSSRPYNKKYERQRNQMEKRKAFHAANLKPGGERTLRIWSCRWLDVGHGS